MLRRTAICVLALAIGLLQQFASAAGQSKQIGGEAPVPVQIFTAKKAFISNAGGGCDPIGRPAFSGGAARPYNQFYAAMKSWGRYGLVEDPGEADLVLEIAFECPAAAPPVFKGNSVGPAYDPQLKLTLLDAKTHFVLWEITRHVEPALLEGNRDKNFDRAMTELVDELKNLVEHPPSQGKQSGPEISNP